MSYLNHKSELAFFVVGLFCLGLVVGIAIGLSVALTAQQQMIDQAIDKHLPAKPKQTVTCVISGPHLGVDSPDFPMKVIDGKIHVKHADTGEWVTDPLDGNEDVYVDAYHAGNPNRRKRFVFVDGEWVETIYDVEAGGE